MEKKKEQEEEKKKKGKSVERIAESHYESRNVNVCVSVAERKWPGGRSGSGVIEGVRQLPGMAGKEGSKDWWKRGRGIGSRGFEGTAETGNAMSCVPRGRASSLAFATVN